MPGRIDAQTIIAACQAYGLDMPDDVDRVMVIESAAYQRILEEVEAKSRQ